MQGNVGNVTADKEAFCLPNRRRGTRAATLGHLIGSTIPAFLMQGSFDWQDLRR